MIFVLRMAGREMRASWTRLAFFFVCVAIGVGAIVGLRSIIQRVRVALLAEVRALVAADVVVQTRQPWTDQMRETIDARLAAAQVLARTESVEIATMVRPADEKKAVARVAEVRGVQAGFPFYGQVVLESGQPYAHALLRDRGALVRPELLAQLGVAVGEPIVIGEQRFTIRGVVLTEPGRRLGAFSFGPRILIDHEDLLGTGLLTTGSRAQYQVLLRVEEHTIASLVGQLREDLKNSFVSARSYRDAETDIDEDLIRAENYLSLIGFVILVLGGIGVWSVTRVFVHQKIKTIAILKCVGGTTRQILAVYLVQVLLLGAGGSALGVALAAAALAAVPAGLVSALPQLSYGLTWSAVLQGAGVGLLVSLLFSLVPLLEVRDIKPLLLLRQELARRIGTLDWVRLGAALVVIAALVGLAAWQAASLRAGLYVSAGFAAVTLVVYVAGALVVRAVAPLARAGWFPLRHAVVHLGRPGNQTRVVLLAVGLGSFFTIGVQALQANLVRELSVELREDAPDMFLIDIQQDQAAAVRRFLASRVGGQPPLIAVLRARVTGVRGREINLDSYDDVRGRGSLGREYVVTYRDHLEANERIVAGQFWGPGSSATAEVSIEENLHERFRINVGDIVRFDVLGRRLEARVTSIREVEWDDTRRGGFMFVFRPGVLDRAPHTYIAVLQAPPDALARARLQRDLAVQFPNVSAIDVREILQIVRRMLGNVTLAVSVVGAIAVFSGVLILVGSVAMTKFQRLHEAAILRTLGASTRTIAAMLVLEYGALGALAGIIGSAGALVLTWALSRHLLDIRWDPTPWLNLGGIAATAVVVATVGVVASLDVLRRKPLATLRAE